MKIEIKTINNSLPCYQTPGSAAMDLCSTEDVTLEPGEIKIINTGIFININDNSIVGVIAPRSGLGVKGLVLANTIGVIDSDYQGEIKIPLLNRNNNIFVDEPISIKAGDRIAQLLFMPIIQASWCVVEEFSNDTDRGAGGFGSTGV